MAAVQRLLTVGGLNVAAESLRARIAGTESGILLCDDASASWVLDAGVLHFYDVVGDLHRYDEIVDALQRIASSAFAAVLSTTVYADTRLFEALTGLGFAIDWEETDVRSGRPARLTGLVREVFDDVIYPTEAITAR